METEGEQNKCFKNIKSNRLKFEKRLTSYYTIQNSANNKRVSKNIILVQFSIKKKIDTHIRIKNGTNQ